MARFAAVVGLVTILVLAATQIAGAACCGYHALFDDPTGDAPSGTPDVAGVLLETLSSSSGDVLMRIYFSSGSADELPSGSRILVYLDTDRNPRTGAGYAHGAEFLIRLDSGRKYSSFRWNGSSFVFKHLPSLHANSAYDWSWWINPSDLDNTTGFYFSIQTWLGDQLGDVAPDTGSTSSSLSPAGTWFWPTTPEYTTPSPPPPSPSPPAEPKFLRANVRPVGVPHAGKPFEVAVSFVVDKGPDPNGQPVISIVRPDTLICVATIGTASPRTTIVQRGVTKNCRVPLVPRTAKGKTLTIVVLTSQARTFLRKELRMVIRA